MTSCVMFLSTYTRRYWRDQINIQAQDFISRKEPIKVIDIYTVVLCVCLKYTFKIVVARKRTMMICTPKVCGAAQFKIRRRV